jgi:hypothetical protein
MLEFRTWRAPRHEKPSIPKTQSCRGPSAPSFSRRDPAARKYFLYVAATEEGSIPLLEPLTITLSQ